MCYIVGMNATLSDVLETVTVPVSIPIQRVKDLLCNAIEGGSNYWVGTLDRKGGKTQAQAEYRQDVPFVKGGWLELVEQEQSGKAKSFEISRNTIQNGLRIMAEKYPKHFINFIQENDDAETGDVFLQCICFGEIVYG
jgi:hypothetical protein